jgi:predicted TIM-barrel fold metal-dependent hydrolase
VYRCAVDVDRIKARDVHVHIERGSDGRSSLPPRLAEAAQAYFRSDGATPDVEGVAAYYRSLGMAAVIFTVDATTAMGHEPISSAQIAHEAADHSDVLIPFGSVDPRRGGAAIDQARSLVHDHGVRGFKFHPTMQAFDPSEQQYRPLFGPALVHTGQPGIGAGLRGGAGLHLRYSDPMLLDEVAADFPELRIILAHPSVPWQDAAISMATHKLNVSIDLAGWSPKYFPPQLVRAAGSFLQDKVLFGSDFPMLTPERWMRDFDQLTIADDIRRKIVRDNATRVLGLAAPPHLEES